MKNYLTMTHLTLQAIASCPTSSWNLESDYNRFKRNRSTAIWAMPPTSTRYLLILLPAPRWYWCMMVSVGGIFFTAMKDSVAWICLHSKNIKNWLKTKSHFSTNTSAISYVPEMYGLLTLRLCHWRTSSQPRLINGINFPQNMVCTTKSNAWNIVDKYTNWAGKISPGRLL